jgi:hypothetical protein
VSLRVLFVSDHGCIRVFKEAEALAQQGVRVDLTARVQPFGVNVFHTFSVHRDAESLKRVVESSRADIVHVHNEPDWMVGAAREATQKPIVFDVHDLNSLRYLAAPDEHERRAFEAADGIVHVSDPCREAAERHHGNGKPTGVLPCLVNERFLAEPLPAEPCWDSMVYEGGLDPRPVQNVGGKQVVSARAIHAAVQAFARAGYQPYLYPATTTWNDPTYIYESLGAVVAPGRLDYVSLLRALRAYGYGFVGSPHDAPLMQAAMPNKLFEYISQGVVPVVFNAGRAAAFVREHGLGIVLEGLDNLREQLVPGPEVRRRILERRHEWTMERHIGAVTQVYQEVAA